MCELSEKMFWNERITTENLESWESKEIMKRRKMNLYSHSSKKLRKWNKLRTILGGSIVIVEYFAKVSKLNAFPIKRY